MSEKSCQFCGFKIPSHASVCGHCGNEQQENAFMQGYHGTGDGIIARFFKKILEFVVAILILWAAVAFFF